MSDKATQVITDALQSALPPFDGFNHGCATAASAVLAAIKAARIAVVELPEQKPDSVRVDGHRTVIYEDTFWLTPEQARADAAALLAAAQKAEENA